MALIWGDWNRAMQETAIRDAALDLAARAFGFDIRGA
jgi:hypothetical protein